MAADGQQAYQKLLDGGFSQQEAEQWKAQQTQKLRGGGFTPQEIDKYWGDDERPSHQLNAVVQHNVSKNWDPSQAQQANTYIDALAAGWDMSVTSLGLRGAPKTVLPQDAGFVKKLLYSMGQMAGDLPATLAGYYTGAVSGAAVGAAVPVADATGIPEAVGAVVGAGAISNALPEAMRQVLIDHYTKGDFLNFHDFVERSSNMAWETSKAAIIGAVAAPIAKFGGSQLLMKTGSQSLSGLTEASLYAASAAATKGALDGKVPDAEDFGVAAVMALGFHAAGEITGATKRYALNKKGEQVAENMRKIYVKTGVPPWEQAQRAKSDPVMRQEIFGHDANDSPAAHNFAADKAQEPPPYKTNPNKIQQEHDDEVTRLHTEAQQAASKKVRPDLNPEEQLDLVRHLERSADDAISPAGAIGRYQIMPGTARQYGFDPGRLKDPIYNEKVAQHILKDLSTKYRNADGSVDMEAVLIAYNAGPGRANNFRATGRHHDQLPVETQRYLEHADRLAGIGGKEPPREPPPPGHDNAEADPFKLNADMLQSKIDDIIGVKDEPSMLTRVKDLASNTYTRYVSELGPARELDRLLEIDPKQVGVEDMFRSTYASSERAGVFMRYGTMDAISLEKTSNESYIGAYKAAKDAGGTMEGFTAYRLAKRTVEKQEQGIESGIDPDVAAAYIKKTQKMYEAADKMINRVKNASIDYATDSGLYTPALAKAIKANNKSHIPFKRVLEGDEKVRFGKGPGRFAARQTLKKMEGSDKQIVEPVYADIENLHTLITMADRNRAIGTIVGAVERNPELLGLKLLPKPEQPKIVADEAPVPEKTVGAHKELVSKLGSNDFVYYRDGVPEVWRADDPLLAKMIRGGTALDTGVVTGIARWFAKIQRSGITTLPDYLAKMVIRDQFTTPIVDKFGGIPFQNLLIGALHVMKQDEAYVRFVSQGGMGSALADMDVKYIQRDVENLFAKTGVFSDNGVVNFVRDPLGAARLLMERVDAMSRLGYMMRREKATGDPLKSAMSARKAYLDFAEKGTSQVMNWFAGITPFLRPTILGIDQLAKAAKENPVGMAVRAAAYITVPSMLLYALNYYADQGLPDNQKYDNLPRWQRDTMWITPPIGGVRIRIPKPRELGLIFGSLPERMLDQQLKDDPRAFKDWASDIISTFLPNVIPTAILPVAEGAYNFSQFSGKSLIPGSLEEASDYMQYTANTSEVAKNLARVMGPPNLNIADVSPIVIDNYVREWTGTFGQDVLKVLNAPMRSDDVGHPPWDFADIPFVSSFVVRNVSLGAAPIQDYYDAVKDVRAKHKDLALAIERQDESLINYNSDQVDAFIDLDEVSSALAAQRSAIDNINSSKDMTDDEKRQYIEDIYTGMLQTAKAGLATVDAVNDSQH